MKFLLFEWNALMQADLEDALTRMNIGYQTFSYQFDEMYEDEYFSENFGRVLKDGEFDAVFSFNCWPLVARACNALHIPYISWIYDSPMPISDPASLSLPTNYIFIFDRGEYVRYVDRGFQTVYHLPLAVNVERLDQIRISEEELPQYVSEVSFVGNMYRSDYRVLESCLTEYERGYFEGLIESQCRVYGGFFVEEMLSDRVLQEIKKRLEEQKKASSSTFPAFREWVIKMVSREITRRERLMILSTVSKRHFVKHYASRREELLPDEQYCGTVNTFSDMPKVFRLSKINLNITYKQILTGMPLRVLDIMGAGGFLLSNYQEELVEHFTPGVDCVIYESVVDAVRKVDYYLQNEEERRMIAQNGRLAVQKFTYQKQLQKMFEIVWG